MYLGEMDEMLKAAARDLCSAAILRMQISGMGILKNPQRTSH